MASSIGNTWPQFGHFISVGIDPRYFYKSKVFFFLPLVFLRCNNCGITFVIILNRNDMKVAAFLFVITGLMGAAPALQAQMRSVSGFSGVANDGSFAVHVKIDGTESLKIVGADAATADKIESVVMGGNLELRWRRGTESHNYSGSIDVYVTAKSLSSLNCTGSGSLDVEGVVSGDHVDVYLTGSGSITSAVNATSLGITVSGPGAVRLKGKADQTIIKVTGSGKISADGLATDVADVSVAGSGDTYITVNKTISANIVGSGSVHYSGNGTIGSVRTVGSGRISKV
jgi:hypothetical protein